jgi:arylsulfatase A-like enzyme
MNRAQKPSPRPNVVLIYSDDQGTLDLGCYGAKDLSTPNLDALARTGVRFTQMYAASAICSPSRAALMTGRLPIRVGVPANLSSAKGDPGMAGAEVTIAEMLKSGGYTTAHIGKWHLGYSPETMPNAQGFDYSFGHIGGCIDNYSHFFYWSGPNRHDLWRNGSEIWEDGRYFPDLTVAEATRFIENHKDRPFFLYWALNMPHYPLQPTEAWRLRYKDTTPPRDKYAAFVSTMDERIGMVLRKIDALALRDNTIIIFQSDQGHSVEERTFGGGGFAGPYRGAKATLFEGGIRVPAIISWPGRIPSGAVRDQMAVACDWLPTIAELTGTPVPERKLDGSSLASVIRSHDAPTPHASFYWRIASGEESQWAVREGDWKLLGNPYDNTGPGRLPAQDNPFLVNLSKDRSERTNRANEYPDIVKRLSALREAYERDVAGH